MGIQLGLNLVGSAWSRLRWRPNSRSFSFRRYQNKIRSKDILLFAKQAALPPVICNAAKYGFLFSYQNIFKKEVQNCYSSSDNQLSLVQALSLDYQDKTIGLIRLCRPKVAFGYFIAGLAGLFIGFSGLPTAPNGVVGLIGIVAATSGIYMFNDIFDLESDCVDSPDRPIPSGVISKRQALLVSGLLFTTSLSLAAISSLTALVLTGILIATGIFYSLPPVRLKRFFFMPNVSLGIMASVSFLIGGSFGPEFTSGVLLVGIMVLGYVLTMGFAKEFKDVEGDQVAGTTTLPILVGMDLGAKIAVSGLLLSYVFFVIPYFLLDLNFLYPVLVSILFVYTAWFSLKFLESEKTKADCREFYDRGLQISITLFVLLILGSI